MGQNEPVSSQAIVQTAYIWALYFMFMTYINFKSCCLLYIPRRILSSIIGSFRGRLLIHGRHHKLALAPDVLLISMFVCCGKENKVSE